MTIRLVVNFVLGAGLAILSLPVTVFFVETMLGCVFRNRKRAGHSSVPCAVTVLIPAHNEEQVIVRTLQSLLADAGAAVRVLVVADNCSDQTVDLCREVGVDVVERFDNERRGKGYALEFGLQQLSDDPPDVVIVIDADCIVEKGAIANLSHAAYQTGCPVQGKYIMHAPECADAKQLISSFAFVVKNWTRPLGLRALGLPCLLTGSGMAFPWNAISSVSLGTGNIVEDMQMAVDLAIAGHSPMFSDDATIVGFLPNQTAAATEQRKRWEHGHLSTSQTEIVRLLKAFARHPRLGLLAMACDLAVPPLALLVAVGTLLSMLTIILYVVGLASLPILIINGLLFVALALGVGISWIRFGRDILTPNALLAVPEYVLGKLPLYTSYIANPQKEWVRTTRDQEADINVS